MKQSGLLCLLLILLLSLHCTASAARLSIWTIPTVPAAALSGINEVTNALSKQGGREGRTEEDNPWQLMGMEECKHGDEECEKRRLLSEAHLDYIYTQGHHKQP